MPRKVRLWKVELEVSNMPRGKVNRDTVCLVFLVAASIAGPTIAADQVRLQVRETAGIRRFGYPVAAEWKLDPPGPSGTNFRLLENGKPIVAQFRTIQMDGDRIATEALDFDGGFMPLESREYIVEYGPDVPPGPEPDRGMKIEKNDEAFLVSNGSSLAWTIPKNLLGLIRSVRTPQGDYLRPDSSGLFIRAKDDSLHRVGGHSPRGSAARARVLKQGPIDCVLRFESTEDQGVVSKVDMEFPRSKSWVRVTWTLDDPKGFVSGLGADLNLNLNGEPTLVDFGAGHYVYATLAKGQAAAMHAGVLKQDQASRGPSWETFRGPIGKLEPYVVSQPGDPVGFAERWAHVMDRDRCTAIAFDFANDTRDRLEVESAGRLQMWRDYATGSRALAPRAKSFTFWLHFVPFPPHVGAVTSPQSMQSPLEVNWKTNEDRLQSAAGRPEQPQALDTTADHQLPIAESLAIRAKAALAQTTGELRLTGLKERVEVLRDNWGIPHIYAQNPSDLFFSQGFVQAQDRLWQMEIWRRTTEGRLAEIVGPAAVERDRVARLLRYRGDMDAEWQSYSPDAKQIIEAFVRGVNAFIEHSRENPPIEFQLSGVTPEPWTSNVCLGRMAGFIMCRNAAAEALRAELVRELGPEQAATLLPTDPARPIKLPDGLELDGVDHRILDGINGVNAAIQVPLADLTPSPLGEQGRGEAAKCSGETADLVLAPLTHPGRGDRGDLAVSSDPNSVGSNNWVVAGTLTRTGKPILANDPHRPITLPSLRYLIHLNCPSRGSDQGWNVIGGTEPALPGVTIGHNDRVGWGLTIVGTDQQDLYSEETRPDDPNKYRVNDEWQSMTIEREELRVRGETALRRIELKFTRHGPVIFEDLERHRCYAMRWTGSEPGTAGYLAALAIDRVRNWPEFLQAAARWKVPSENLIYADVDGHIGWIAAALTPVRRGWDGLLPVPGAAGGYEWDGWLPTAQLPQWFDPPQGYVATANHNILPPGYPHSISFEWAAPFRFGRIDEVLRTKINGHEKFSIGDFEKLQHDATSIPARRLLAVLRGVKVQEAPLQPSLDLLLRWDGVLDRGSAAAALYEVWQTKLSERVLKARVPEKLWERYSNRLPLQAMLHLIEQPDASFGSDPGAGRDAILIESLRDAATEVEKRLGPDPSQWRWGKIHQANLRHMLAQGPKAESGEPTAEGQQKPASEKQETAKLRSAIAVAFNLAPVPRDGDGNTPFATGGPNFEQTTGASYRHILDLADWDRSVATSVPGQSGQPTSPHYSDLLPLWVDGRYFPLLFSRTAIEACAPDRLVLLPKE